MNSRRRHHHIRQKPRLTYIFAILIVIIPFLWLQVRTFTLFFQIESSNNDMERGDRFPIWSNKNPSFDRKRNISTASSASRKNGTTSTIEVQNPGTVLYPGSSTVNLSVSDWTLQYSEVFERMIQQETVDSEKNINAVEIDHETKRFPPRLKLPPQHDPSLQNATDPLTFGVFFAGTGDIGFIERRIVPALQHLVRELKIPRAKERKKLRRQNQRNIKNIPPKPLYDEAAMNTGYALLISSEFRASPTLQPYLNFFDVIYDPDQDLPDWPINWRMRLQSGNEQNLRGHSKAVKVHAMASSPFDISVFMDFDTFPCRTNSVGELLQLAKNADMAVSNKYIEMDAIPTSLEDHWMSEHNTALVVLNMMSNKMRTGLGLYVNAFHQLWEIHPPNARIPPRDQPAFMIALRALRQLLQQTTTFVDNTKTTDAATTQMFLNHVDLPHNVFCRQRTNPKGQPMVCGGKESPCLFAHKPDQIVKRRGSFAH